MEKYGFIYIWFDRKRKKYYLGCHWGHEDDGYICSSNRMRNAYRRRPQDFKRKIIKTNVSRENLLEEEHKWLSLISDSELGQKYYNLRKHKWGHWSTDENRKLTIGQKISDSPNRRQRISEANKGRILSKETRNKISESVSKTMTEEHRKLLSDKVKGFKHSEEAKRKISEAGIGRVFSSEARKKMGDANRGKTRIVSEETRKKISFAALGKKRGPYKKKVKETIL